MGKSTIGPEFTDVAMFLSALDALHGCRTELIITAGLNGKNGSMDVKLVSSFPVASGRPETQLVESTSEFPCVECSNLAMHIYNGLYRHDFAISQAYENKSIAEL